MCTGEVGEQLRQTLRVILRALEVGDWDTALHAAPTHPAGRPVGGSAQLVHAATALRIIAHSMWRQVEGDVHGASDQLTQAVGYLPHEYGQGANPTLAALRPGPDGRTFTAEVAWRAARIIWREQYELAELLAEFAPGLMTPREELTAAYREHMFWVEFDPYTWTRPTNGSRRRARPPTPDRSRKSLCLRATALRHYGDLTQCDVSQSVWRDVGALRGLYAEALDQLANRKAPASWCGQPDTRGLPVRRGRLRAWQYARTWRNDLGYWS